MRAALWLLALAALASLGSAKEQKELLGGVGLEGGGQAAAEEEDKEVFSPPSPDEVKPEDGKPHYVDPTSTDPSSCPVMFTGPGCQKVKPLPSCLSGRFKGSWITLSKGAVGNSDAFAAGEDIPHDVVAKLPSFDVFGTANLPFRSCAVVSNSAALNKKSHGKRIDVADIVMRLNGGPTKGHEKDVGSKTTMRLTAAEVQGWREKDEVVMAKWCNEKRCGFSQELKRLINKKAHPFNPDFFSYVGKNFKQSPTSGLTAIVLLMHVCEKVDAYGFYKSSGIKAWYFNHRKKTKGKQPPKKDWLREKDWTVPQWSYIGTEGQGKGWKGLKSFMEGATSSPASSSSSPSSKKSKSKKKKAPAKVEPKGPQHTAASLVQHASHKAGKKKNHAKQHTPFHPHHGPTRHGHAHSQSVVKSMPGSGVGGRRLLLGWAAAAQWGRAGGVQAEPAGAGGAAGGGSGGAGRGAGGDVGGSSSSFAEEEEGGGRGGGGVGRRLLHDVSGEKACAQGLAKMGLVTLH